MTDFRPPLQGSGGRRRGFRGVGWVLLLLALAGGSVVASRLGYVERARNRLWGRVPRLSPGDFPAGVSAPGDEVASIPSRATVIGVNPRGCVAPLALAAGDAERVGLFRAGYALDVKLVSFAREDELRRALVKGGENGGVDLAALSVSTLAMSATALRDAAPRTVLLLGRSRGQEALGALSGITKPSDLAGKRLATEPRSTAHYFALWVLSRAGLALRDVTLVPLESSFAAGQALARGDADVVAGFSGEIGPAAKERGGSIVFSTVDAPHLIATVLVSRGDYAARYPDAMRRLVRGVLDANAQALKEPLPAARALGALAPELGDPSEAMAAAPPASLKDNLAFFGLGGESPVTYPELYQSAAALAAKLGQGPVTGDAEDTADLGALKYVSSAKSP